MSKTLDTIFVSNSAAHKEKPALIDHTSSERSVLSFGETSNYIANTARHLNQFGFSNGGIVAIEQMTAIDHPLLVLSLMRTGLVPCLIPSNWRRSELEIALKPVSPVAIISHMREGGTDHSAPDKVMSLFEVAAAIPSIRFLLGPAGTDVDGVTPLLDRQSALASPAEDHILPPHRRTENDAALIDWCCSPGGKLKPIIHTHTSLVANTANLLGGLNGAVPSTLLTNLSQNTLTGITGAFVPWILLSATMHLTRSIDPAKLAALISEHEISATLIPEGLAAPLATQLDGWSDQTSNRPHLFLAANLLQSAIKHPGGELKSGVSYLYNLNGFCVHSVHAHEFNTRDTTTPSHISLNENNGFTARLKGGIQKAESNTQPLQGEIEIGGTIVGQPMTATDMTTAPLEKLATEFQSTTLKGTIEDEAMQFISIARDSDYVYCGNTIIDAAELDELYQSYAGFRQAAALAVHDPVLGERLFAAIVPESNDAISYLDFRHHLQSLHISPVKIPEKLITVSELPRNPNGAIQRRPYRKSA